MRDIVLLYIYDKWHYHNITEGENGVMCIRDFRKTFKPEAKYYCTQISEFIKQYNDYTSYFPLPILIDIESFSKQFIQKSKPLESQDKWNMFRILKERQLLPDGFQITEETIFEYISKIGEFIQNIAEDTEYFEMERFTDIEIPINKIIYERQRKGIAVDVDSAKEKIQSLEEAVYQTKNKLQLDHKIFTPENNDTQVSWLEINKFGIIDSIERTFKNYSKVNEICKLFYDLIRNQKDLDCFLDMLAHEGGILRTYPSFHGFGTITSRITLREPALQNLRRENRIIIKPDKDCTFIYIDYSQFEAGILASLSKDEKLCKLYDLDIYNDMVSEIEGLIEREDAKIEFYKFMYGASNLSPAVKKYFSRFKKLQAFKKKIEEEAKDTKIVGTTLGNYRSVRENVTLSLSHTIQATASLIFKKAIIKADKEVREAKFVLPMHDAALYQVKNNSSAKKIKDQLISIFKEVYHEHCPLINPRVNEKSFYE